MSTVKSAGKVLKVLKALRGHTLNGISIKDLAEQLGDSAPQVHRALQTLVDEGLAKQGDDGLYYMSTAMVQIAKAHDQEMQRAQARIDEINQRTSVIF